MKKIICLFAVVALSYAEGSALNMSYHSLIKEANSNAVVSHPICENAEILQEEMTKSTFKFVEQSDDSEASQNLLNVCKKVFLNEENTVLINELEKEKVSSSYDVNALADELVDCCRGLPEAANKIYVLYEQQKNYSLALLWAMVAYKFRLPKAEEQIGRILLEMKE